MNGRTIHADSPHFSSVAARFGFCCIPRDLYSFESVLRVFPDWSCIQKNQIESSCAALSPSPFLQWLNSCTPSSDSHLSSPHDGLIAPFFAPLSTSRNASRFSNNVATALAKPPRPCAVHPHAFLWASRCVDPHFVSQAYCILLPTMGFVGFHALRPAQSLLPMTLEWRSKSHSLSTRAFTPFEVFPSPKAVNRLRSTWPSCS
jgi:hypothetical protein